MLEHKLMYFYKDLKAIFVYLPHAILLAKLDKPGLRCSLLQWLISYVMNRSYVIKIDILKK